MYSQTDESFELNTSHHSRRSELFGPGNRGREKGDNTRIFMFRCGVLNKNLYVQFLAQSTDIETKLSVLISLFHEH